MVSVAIMQPVYIPWLGYFEQMCRTDTFMFLDDVQYTKWDWRSRNRIRTQNGWSWLTIPVKQDSMETEIKDKTIADPRWKRKHVETLRHNYGRCPYFDEVIEIFRRVISSESPYLIDYTIPLVQEISRYLGLDVPTLKSSSVPRAATTKHDRILELCRSVDADVLYTGPAAKDYMDLDYMRENGLQVAYQDYAHPTYRQAYPGFETHMSIIDLLMNYGPESRQILENGGVT